MSLIAPDELSARPGQAVPLIPCHAAFAAWFFKNFLVQNLYTDVEIFYNYAKMSVPEADGFRTIPHCSLSAERNING